MCAQVGGELLGHEYIRMAYIVTFTRTAVLRRMYTSICPGRQPSPLPPPPPLERLHGQLPAALGGSIPPPPNVIVHGTNMYKYIYIRRGYAYIHKYIYIYIYIYIIIYTQHVELPTWALVSVCVELCTEYLTR